MPKRIYPLLEYLSLGCRQCDGSKPRERACGPRQVKSARRSARDLRRRKLEACRPVAQLIRHSRFQLSVRVSDLQAEPSKPTVDFLAKVLEDPDVRLKAQRLEG